MSHLEGSFIDSNQSLARYGQTNCFVGPSLQYGIFPSKNPNEAYLCTYRAARNMAFQGSSSTQHQVEQLFELEGSQIVGSRVKAPFAVNSVVYVLPMDNVLATKVYIPLGVILV